MTDDTGESLVEVWVEVVDGGTGTAYTEADGSFALVLAPGTYTLEVSFPMFEPRTVTVIVSAGRVTTADIALSLSEEAIEVIRIEGKIETNSEAAQLQLRKLAATVSDSLSAQEIARTPDSSASDAVKRVVSATVEDDKYVLIRGMGGRYVGTVLNGVSLPSPDPDRQSIPLDLFPTSLLSNITVRKSYSADLPGTFGGGTLVIDTRSYPTDFALKLKLTTGFNSESTFRTINAQPGGSFDFLGYDDGARELPQAVPNTMPVSSDNLSQEEIERIGEAFPNRWQLTSQTAWPDLGVGAEVGDTVMVGNHRLGYLGTVSFGHKLRRREGHTGKSRVELNQVMPYEKLAGSDGVQEANLGVLGNVGYEFGPGHTINGFSLYTHDGEALSSFIWGFNENDSEDVEQTRLQFVERELSFTQLSGSHRFAEAGNLEINWQGNLSFSFRREPSTRDITYTVHNPDLRIYKNQPGSGEIIPLAFDQTSLGSGLDVALPIGRSLLRAGVSVQHTEYSFQGRTFRYRYNTVDGDPTVRQLDPENMLTPENIGTNFSLQEDTRASDGFDAELDLASAFAAADVKLTEALRVIAGLRFEYVTQELQTGSTTATGGMPQEITRNDPDILPAANIVYNVTEDVNLRAAYSYTLSRPLFRERAPLLYYDPIARVTREGDPNLEVSHIHNTDLRLEWFAGAREVFAISGFYKDFRDPIVQSIFSAGGSRKYINAAAGRSFGLELEARASLARLTPALADFDVGANVAFISSSVDLGANQAIETNAERPLQGQAPYVINVKATYDNPTYAEVTLLYNVLGPSLVEIGTEMVPDVYEQPFHKLDLVARRKLDNDLTLKLAATNLLNATVESLQGNIPVLQYQPGLTVSLAVEWTP